MGRNWLHKSQLQLDWSLINKVHNSRLHSILSKYSTVFGEDLGTLKDFQAHIYVDPTVYLLDSTEPTRCPMP